MRQIPHSIAKQSRLGLTLVELLVVIAILGVLATGVVPSVDVLMANSQSQDVEATLRASWQLAIASAQAQSKPVVWQVHADPTSLQLDIRDAQHDPLWSTSIAARNASIFVADATQGQGDASLVIYPHGLTQNVIVEWQTQGTHHRIDVSDMPKTAIDPQEQ